MFITVTVHVTPRSSWLALCTSRFLSTIRSLLCPSYSLVFYSIHWLEASYFSAFLPFWPASVRSTIPTLTKIARIHPYSRLVIDPSVAERSGFFAFAPHLRLLQCSHLLLGLRFVRYLPVRVAIDFSRPYPFIPLSEGNTTVLHAIMFGRCASSL